MSARPKTKGQGHYMTNVHGIEQIIDYYNPRKKL